MITESHLFSGEGSEINSRGEINKMTNHKIGWAAGRRARRWVFL